MTCFRRSIYALLIAGALLAGCDISSPPAAATPPPSNAATPATNPGEATPVPGGGPSNNPTAYPAPAQIATPTFPPGYVPPATAQP
jgi:hypothetical protein